MYQTNFLSVGGGERVRRRFRDTHLRVMAHGVIACDRTFDSGGH